MSDPVITDAMLEAAVRAEDAATDIPGYTDRSCLRAAIAAALKLSPAYAAGYAKAREDAAKLAAEREAIVRTRNCDGYTEGFADGCASCEVSIRAIPTPEKEPTP